MENEIFKRCNPDFDKLIEYGFIKGKTGFKFKKFFRDNSFIAVINIDFDGKITGKVYDIENDDEFLPLKAQNHKGTFVAEIRAEYEKILEHIRDNCFGKEYFVSPQSNRITDLIIKNYGDYPEFLWEKFDGSGVFRNKKTKKWYAAILEVNANKFYANQTGIIEVLDIKLLPENIIKLLEYPDFYPAYHMNKKHWITIILDDSLTDDKITELIEESYELSGK